MEINPIFRKALDKAASAIEKADEIALTVRWFYVDGNAKETYEQAMKLEEQVEKLVLLTRALPAYTGAPEAHSGVEKIMAQIIPVEIGFTKEGWFSVRLPMLLPKKSSGSADYIRSFLYPAMRRFFMNKLPVRYRDCVLIYRHVYDKKRPERQRRDHDNIEINMVSDIIAMYVMPDDGPSTCAHYYLSAVGNSERTEVYVVPKSEFPIWLAKEESIPQEGVRLYENRDEMGKKDM